MARKPKKAADELPIAPLPDLMRWWKSQRIRGVVIGGLAVSLQAKPRITRDIDGLVLVPSEQWDAFLKAGRQFGFVPRIPDALEYARKARILLLRHEKTAIDIDVTLGELEFEEEAIARAVHFKIEGVTVSLATPEDLIIMKAIARREQDWLDIDALLAAHPALDRRWVRRWARVFAEAFAASEIVAELEMRLKRQTKGKRKTK